MAERKKIKFQNKTGKPDNIIKKELELFMQCTAIEEELPAFMRGFFIYLRGNVLPLTRLAYLRDVHFFCGYLMESGAVSASVRQDITVADFEKIKAKDVNVFLDYARKYQKETEKAVTIYENSNKSLARKKSSLSVLFKYLYRDEILTHNITAGLDPIRVPKPGEHEIKALQDDEVMRMLDIVSTGIGLTNKQKEFWQKTKKRDKAILILFLTYGLRLSELQQLNVSSFNFDRGEFKIYRKRGKESIMPINQSTEIVIMEYLEGERPSPDSISEEDKDALFLSLQGKRMTERQIRELVKKYSAFGLKTSQKAGYSPHKLRATAATSLIGRGEDIYDVQALLDHEQVTTTQLYAKHKQNVKRNLVNNMEWELERKDNDR
ncbi:tyrosine-type recombinase/integrase [Clostridium aminobutyricum]|uniref:Tyrosine-type recombinase/integrase n=1 Tax=Clostridium aminobutyricum TaxID=33953 RepID=A0A939III2_CLOAM|nr:tyrosine-type recombinase/integrase [Clostridium aminobutyricum]MBN7772514.1 tyrosine-type recombinase/integrase [Clostridium aminobutyricum]